jgi:hypothetical protein
MHELEMLAKLEEYFEREFKDTVRAVNNGWGDRKDTIKCGLQRCLGAADFTQNFGISFETIDKIYNEYREKFYKLF